MSNTFVMDRLLQEELGVTCGLLPILKFIRDRWDTIRYSYPGILPTPDPVELAQLINRADPHELQQYGITLLDWCDLQELFDSLTNRFSYDEMVFIPRSEGWLGDLLDECTEEELEAALQRKRGSIEE